MGSSTNFVEIDLLRLGESMLILGATDRSDRILVSRSYRRPDADLYPFGLKDPILTFSVPLHEREPELIVDLQRLLNAVERARLDMAMMIHSL